MCFLKFLIKYFVFGFIDFIARVSFGNKPDGDILIVRLDAIGDYVLFRNFLYEIKKNPKYSSYNVTLVGNIAWREVAESIDKSVVDNFIWIDRNKFVKNLFYRFCVLKRVASCGYRVVINPTYSREFFISDAIVKVSYAQEKIGSCGDLSNITIRQKRISDKYYSQLIPASRGICFEFDRNREFFSKLLNCDLSGVKPTIDTPPSIDISKFFLPTEYAVIFIGANALFRKWRSDNYAYVAKHLKHKYGIQVVLCGGPGDVSDVVDFVDNVDFEFINLVGKTTLPELIAIIKKAKVVISNETSTPHFAVALNVANVFVVSNGNHIVRFSPYPDNITENYHVIYHPDILEKWDYYLKGDGSGTESALNINNVKAESVIEIIDKNIKL